MFPLVLNLRCLIETEFRKDRISDLIPGQESSSKVSTISLMRASVASLCQVFWIILRMLGLLCVTKPLMVNRKSGLEGCNSVTQKVMAGEDQIPCCRRVWMSVSERL